jgi:hypothetical protein
MDAWTDALVARCGREDRPKLSKPSEWPGWSVVKDRQVEPGNALGVGENVD